MKYFSETRLQELEIAQQKFRPAVSQSVPQYAFPSSSEAFPIQRRFSRHEYYRMGEAGIFAPDEHVELIEGMIFQMQTFGKSLIKKRPLAPQSELHAGVGMLVEEVLRVVFGPGFVIRSQKPLALGLLSDPEPDVAVVHGPARQYLTAHPTTALLVVEISDTTLAYDRTIKASLYAHACIAEYWIINIPERIVEVHRKPCTDATMPSGYGYAQILRYDADENIAPLAAQGATVTVADLLP